MPWATGLPANSGPKPLPGARCAAGTVHRKARGRQLRGAVKFTMYGGGMMNREPSQLFHTPAVRIVRAQAGDAERLANFYLGLSLVSRYQRFFSHRPRYT